MTLLTPGFVRAPEVPPAAAARLREADPRLSMRFIQSAAGSYWAIQRTWDEHDPRRAGIQRQEIPPDAAQDIVAMLPGDVSPDEAGQFVERYFVKSADPKADAVRMAAEAVKREQEAQAKQLEQFMAAQEEDVRTTTDHDRRLMVGADTAHPMVAGADFSAGAAGELPPAPAPKKKRGRSADASKPE